MSLLFPPLPLGAGGRAVTDALREHVRLSENQHFVGPELDLGPAVLAEDDLVAFLEIHLDVLPVLVPGTGTDGEDAAALRLLLRRVGQHDAAGRGLLVLEDLHDQAVTKRLQVHPLSSWSDDFVTPIGTLLPGVPAHSNVRSGAFARCQAMVCYKVVVRREFSAGGVVVRRLRGRWMVAAIRPAGKKTGVWALPKGLIGSGEKAEATALREVTEETGVEATPVEKLGDIRYVYTWEGERVFKVVSFFLFRYASGRLGDVPAAHAHEVAEVRWLPLDEAPRLLAYKGEREMAVKALDRLRSAG